MIVQKARSPSASRSCPWPLPAAARPGLVAPRSASIALQASAPGELRGELGSISCHMSAAQPSRVGSRILLADADAKQKVFAISAEAIGS